MDIKDKQARIRLFLQLIESFKAETWVDNIYAIIEQYDMPAHLDRDFVIDALVEHYVRKEEYEKCANLMKWKEDLLRIDLVINEASASINDDETGKSKYKDGFKVPDSIRQRFKRKRDK
jgi:hypothetical protein